tara:strand:- start:527 stop:793 length:267 start_codon:yes stop_codon:yes gene_type:complete
MNLIEEITDQYQRALNTMGGSGIDWIDTVFRLCVVFLVDLADFLGVSYEEINIWIFVIIWPVLTLMGIIWIAILKFRIRKLKYKLRAK